MGLLKPVRGGAEILPVAINEYEKATLPSSFRDPAGFLFTKSGTLYRQINKIYASDYDLLMQSGLYQALVDAKLLISHHEVNSSLAKGDLAYKIIKPEKIETISYPYEWCFSQLKDAALTTIKIQRIALTFGMILKDASAYNVQFHKGKPVFIDTLSFTRYQEDAPWIAYKQFCQHFLAPLALISNTDSRLAELSKNYIDGVPLDLASRLLPVRSYLNYSLLAHIHLHARAQQKFSSSKGSRNQGKGPRNVSRKALSAFLKDLHNAIKTRHWKLPDTEWGDYYSATNYQGHSMRHKEEAVGRFLTSLQPSELTVHDLGANDGRFSRIATKLGFTVVSQDIDPVAVEKNYLQVKRNKGENLLPLQLDLTNPSPAIGWSLAERMSFTERVNGKIVLALAIVHHMAISNNVPMKLIAKHFADLASYLIIEFVPKSDSQAKRLLSSRKDIFDDYTKEKFEEDFSQFFSFRHRENITGSERTLYLMAKK